ncbi:hypothetical protein B0H11DRAFT_2257752 [Mycena galericulata]|nr:hypothetical protein B0H11DRAFT_2257752 [Mycena galericulata]
MLLEFPILGALPSDDVDDALASPCRPRDPPSHWHRLHILRFLNTAAPILLEKGDALPDGTPLLEFVQAGQGEPAAHVCLDGIIRKMAIQTVFPLLIAIDDFQTLAGHASPPSLTIISPIPCALTFPIVHNLAGSPYSSLSNSRFEPDLWGLARQHLPYPHPLARTTRETNSAPRRRSPTWRSTSSAARAPEERCPQKSDLDYVKRPENARVAPLPPRARQSRRVLHTKGACASRAERPPSRLVQRSPPRESACSGAARAQSSPVRRVDIHLTSYSGSRWRAGYTHETRRGGSLRSVCGVCVLLAQVHAVGARRVGMAGARTTQPVRRPCLYLARAMGAVVLCALRAEMPVWVRGGEWVFDVSKSPPQCWNRDRPVPALHIYLRTVMPAGPPIPGVTRKLVVESGPMELALSTRLTLSCRSTHHTLPVQQHAGSVHSSLHPRQKMSPLQWSSQLVAGDVHVPPEQPTFVGPSLQSPNLSHCLRPPSDGPPPPASSSGAFEVA